MSRDTLSNMLRAIRLRGAMFYHVEGTAPWLAEAAPSAAIVSTILPGAEHMMEFHGVASGTCWAGIVGEPPIRLEAGDLVIFPQGDAHTIGSRPNPNASGADMGFYTSPRPAQLPYVLRVTEQGPTERTRQPGETDGTIVCGFIGCDVRPFNPLLAALPRMLHVPGQASGGSAWLAGVLDAVVQESSAKRTGGEAVLERMAEMLFVEALRRYLDALPEGQTGWLAGLGDAVVGRALARLHDRPSEAWTLERLAESAAVSRTTLHERFVQLIGLPPMQYLAYLRMQLAARWLRDTDAKVLEVALEVGYENEAAFARAFRRSTGESPAAWRRARRTRLGRHGSDRAPAPPARRRSVTA